MDASGQAFIRVAARDILSGLGSIQVLEATNASVVLPSFPPGFRDPGVVTATKQDPEQLSRVGLQVTTLAGQTITCDPVVAQLVRQRGQPRTDVFANLPQAENKVRLTNGRPGLDSVEVLVNGHVFKLEPLQAGAVRTLDVAHAMRPGANNRIVVTTHGPNGSSALLVISD